MPYIPTNQKPPSIRKRLILRATLCFALCPALVIGGMAIDDAQNNYMYLQNAAPPVIMLSLPALLLGWLLALAFPRTIARRPRLCCGIFAFAGAVYADIISFIFVGSRMLSLICIFAVIVAGIALALWLHFYPLVERPAAEPTLEAGAEPVTL